MTEELEERLEDEESERASLVSRLSRRSGSPPTKPARGSGVLGRLLGRNSRAAYEPIRSGDE